MGLRPIFSSLMRNGAGAILVAIQIALTLAIVVNAVFVTQQRVTKIGRDSGMDDQNHVRGAGHELRKEPRLLRDGPRRPRDAARDAGRHRCRAHHPGSAVGWRQFDQFYSLPDKKGEKSPVAYYNTDEHGVKTLGVKLADGKNFSATDVEFRPKDVQGFPGTARGDARIRRSAVSEGQGPSRRQDLLRRSEQTRRHRRRHRADAWRLGGLGQARPRDADARS